MDERTCQFNCAIFLSPDVLNIQLPCDPTPTIDTPLCGGGGLVVAKARSQKGFEALVGTV